MVKLTVIPLPVQAAQKIACQLHELLADPECLVGDINIDAKSIAADLEGLFDC